MMTIEEILKLKKEDLRKMSIEQLKQIIEIQKAEKIKLEKEIYEQKLILKELDIQ